MVIASAALVAVVDWGIVRAGAGRVPEARVADRPTQIASDGYSSSQSCKACHPSQYAAWYSSYHRTMTQLATPETVVASSNESIGDLDVFSPAPKTEPAPMPAAAAPMTEEEPLVSAPAAAAAASAFGQLASRVGMPPASQTLDDVVRELLRPLLKDWLDANLAGIVQAKVEEEVERLARRRGA